MPSSQVPPPQLTSSSNNAILDDYELLNSSLDRIGVPRGVVGLAAGFGLLLLVFILSGPQLFGELVGVIYPLFSSLKALERLEQRSESTQWLFYWIIFGVFSLLESFEAITHFLPVFFTIKIVFLIWAQHPQTRGAEFLYHRVSPVITWLLTVIQQRTFNF
jgi:receptor expression-enhancing protein 5/6